MENSRSHDFRVFTEHQIHLDLIHIYMYLYNTDVLYSNRFDKCSDLSTTYLGRTDMTRETKVKAKEISQFQDRGLLWENC